MSRGATFDSVESSGSRSHHAEPDSNSNSSSFNSSSTSSSCYSYPHSSSSHPPFHPLDPHQHHQTHIQYPSQPCSSSAGSLSSHPSYPSTCKPRSHPQFFQEQLHSPTCISSAPSQSPAFSSISFHPHQESSSSIGPQLQAHMMTYPNTSSSQVSTNKSQAGQTSANQPPPPHPSLSSASYSQTGILPPLRTSSPDSTSPYSSYHYDEPGLQHQRNLSMSSQLSQPPIPPMPSTSSHSAQPLQATPTELSDSWSSLPGPSRSRTGSTFSLTGHLEGMEMNNDNSPALPAAPGTSFPIRSHLPHLFSNDRRSSFDDRSVSANAYGRNYSWESYSREHPHQIPIPPHLNPSQAGANSRHWPWPPAPHLQVAYGGPHLRHSSVSGAPIQYEHYRGAGSLSGAVGVGGSSSYSQEYHQLDSPGPSMGGPQPEWMSNGSQFGSGYGMGGAAAGRIRSASGSAMGRLVQHPYDMGMGPGNYMDPLYHSTGSPGSASTSTSTSQNVGTGTGIARRAKFKRSRNGCLMCRKRKVKCSQDGSPCKQCRTGKRECVYEDPPPKRVRNTKKAQAAAAAAAAARERKEKSKSEYASSSENNGYHDVRRLSTATAATDASSSPSSGSFAHNSGVSFTMPFDSTGGSVGSGWSGTGTPPPITNHSNSPNSTSNDSLSHPQHQPHYTLSSVHDHSPLALQAEVTTSTLGSNSETQYQSTSTSYNPLSHHQIVNTHSGPSHPASHTLPSMPFYQPEYVSPLEPTSSYSSSGYAPSEAAFSVESARSR